MKTPHILQNPEVHYCTHKCRPLVLILRQLNPVHASPTHSLMINFIIILPPMARSLKWSLSLRSPQKKPYSFKELTNETELDKCINISVTHTKYHVNSKNNILS